MYRVKLIEVNRHRSILKNKLIMLPNFFNSQSSCVQMSIETNWLEKGIRILQLLWVIELPTDFLVYWSMWFMILTYLIVRTCFYRSSLIWESNVFHFLNVMDRLRRVIENILSGKTRAGDRGHTPWSSTPNVQFCENIINILSMCHYSSIDQ